LDSVQRSAQQLIRPAESAQPAQLNQAAPAHSL
jgi:hypothetical protein